jgi:hypothetical protein
MQEIPLDLMVAESSIAAGVAAMERIHGRHLGDMSPDEQAQAREHWRRQVEEVLAAVRDAHAEVAAAGGGRAVLTFADAGGDHVDVGVAFEPDLRELPNGDVEGTPAQLLALSAIEAIAEAEEEE